MTFVFSLAECERRTQTITLPNQSNADGPVLVSPPGLIPILFLTLFIFCLPCPNLPQPLHLHLPGRQKLHKSLGILICFVRKRMQIPKLLSGPDDRTTSQPSRKQVFHVLALPPRIDTFPVTSLESIVLQLQEASRDIRRENMELRQEVACLRYKNRERERSFVQSRKPSQVPDNVLPPTSLYLGHTTTGLLPQQEPYTESFSYPSACPAYNDPGNFINRPTLVAFPNQDDSDGFSESLPVRGGKYTAYPYATSDSSHNARLPMSRLPGLNSGKRVSQSQSPCMEPHSLPSSAALGSFSGPYHDEHKGELDNTLNHAPDVFPNGTRYSNVADVIPNSHLTSPTTSTSSATSLPLTLYPISFQNPSTSHERADFDDRNPSLPQLPNIQLHGGLANISLTGQPNDLGGYRLTRRSDLPIGEHHNSEPVLNEALRLQGRRHQRDALHPYHRSPSPASSQLSCTVVVIKAHAFGTVHRTRTKTKKSTNGAAKVAQEVLEARGIGIGSVATSSTKRARLGNDEDIGTP